MRAENRALRKVMADAQPRLGFLYHRLINSYGEHPSVDYLIHARVVLDALKTFGDVDSKGTDAGCNPVPSGQPGASPGVSISDSAAQHVPLNGPQNPVSGVGPQGAEKVAAGSDLAPTEKCAECGHARRWHVEGRLGIPGFNGCGHSVKTSLLDSTACECWPFRPAASPPELWRGTIADAKGPDFPSADEVKAKIDEVGDWRKRGTDLLAAPPREPKPMVDSLGSTINHEPRPSREPREAERGRFCGVYGCGETHGCSTFTQHCWVCGCPADDIDGQSHYGGCARLDDAAASPQVEGAKEFILRAAFEALVQRWRKEAHSYVHRDRPDYEYARCEALNECAESLSRLLGGGE